jgi:hypothetical protein
MAAYSKCVVSNMDNLEKGVCESQFAAFVKCAKRVRDTCGKCLKRFCG